MRQKNALRGHFIAPYKTGAEETDVTKENLLELAKWIKDVSDDTDEKQKMKRIMTVTEPKKPL